ncbi:hypothetical protein FB45DRAFT_895360 [Roridomyces roridus]|uniref:MYND-type domain-containing protein n=1 Tax=Roridomyces roridus TaxID=1738132 RepID=A0AAD7CAN3_9AGAR|nr:hypothetical protein FB45DRAFT_895360 [Roridomyces roridus]
MSAPEEIQAIMEDPVNMVSGPVRCDTCEKTAAEAGLTKLRICSGCGSAPYCSVECQKKDWKNHKADCKRVTSGELAREGLSQPVGNIGDGNRQGTRTTWQVLQDLSAWAQIHNGDTLTVTAWQALGLLTDINARKSKVLVLSLRRTQSTDPKTYHTLKEACVVPLSELKAIFANRSPMNSPSRMLRDDEKKRQEDGGIGSVMVVSIEMEDDDQRPVMTALSQISTMTFQPLGVFNVHQTSLSRVGQLPERLWKACLANSLRGGVYAPTFRTS